MARVLVACEFSGVVRNAFLARGHDAWSCDLLPAEDGSERHITGDARNHLHEGWDLIVAHPPCTRLCNSGVRGYRREGGVMVGAGDFSPSLTFYRALCDRAKFNFGEKQ